MTWITVTTMRYRISFTMAWVVATLMTGGLVMAVVQVVESQSAVHTVRPLSAAEVDELPSVAGRAGNVPDGNSPPSSGLVPDPPDRTQVENPAPGRSPASPAGGDLPIAGQVAPVEQMQVFHLVGGSVGVRVAGDSVMLDWATPNSGFRVEVEDAGPGRVSVEFESRDHTSVLSVVMSDGEMNPEIFEGASSSDDPDDGDKDDDEDGDDDDG